MAVFILIPGINVFNLKGLCSLGLYYGYSNKQVLYVCH